MTSNGSDVIVLDSIISQKKSDMAADLSDSDFFELFTIDQVLKNYDLTPDDLDFGKVGGGGDGGIDGFFTFVNKELLKEDIEIDSIKRNPLIEVFFIQATRSPSFTESYVDKINTTLAAILNLSNDLSDFESIFNVGVIEKAKLFRKTYLDLASRHPDLKVKYVYASRGDTSSISSGVNSRIQTLRHTIEHYLPGVTIETKFWGARELLDASRLEKSYTLQLQFVENYISTREDNYVLLVRLKDLYKFVTDEDGNLRRYIFESNVRDYQGNIEVNRDIRKTLDLDDQLDFWWLNNGITILASEASITYKAITLDDVQVVNGLQTTTEIYHYFKNSGTDKADDRCILIRIIVTEDAEARDRIIKATNFQTSIPIASLKATDRIQRNIEDYFLQNGWFYDRRKNYYKNLGKPLDKIISIPYLAQAVMTLVLREADNARARPSSLIKRDADYHRVFSDSINPSTYLLCSKIMKRVDKFLRRGLDIPLLTNYFKFHIATITTMKLIGKKIYDIDDLISLSDEDYSEDILKATSMEIGELVVKYSAKQGFPIDRIAKSADFIHYLIDKINVS